MCCLIFICQKIACPIFNSCSIASLKFNVHRVCTHNNDNNKNEYLLSEKFTDSFDYVFEKLFLQDTWENAYQASLMLSS